MPPLPDTPRVRTALTHRSASPTVSGSNERLEFLGDALLSAFVARFLLEALPPETDEGALTRMLSRIVRRETLAEAARGLGIGERLQMGVGERKDNRQTGESPLADAYEAVVAAIFFDQGYDVAERFVRESLAGVLRTVVETPPQPDAKTELQMRLLAAGDGNPRYAILSEDGVGQKIVFTAAVYTSEGAEPLGTGRGPSKRAAQTEAARAALNGLGT